jgi:hypothetical protein
MSTTTYPRDAGTLTINGHHSLRCCEELLDRYRLLIGEQRLSWTVHQRLMRKLAT